MQRALVFILIALLTCAGMVAISRAAQAPVSVGTPGAKVSLDTNFGNIHANFTELYGKTTTLEGNVNQAVNTTSNPVFNSLSTTSGSLSAAGVQVVKQWTSGLSYTVGNTAVVHGGVIYVCIASHLAAAETEPGVGAAASSAWATVTAGGGAATINDLTDVDTTGKASGKVLKFDALGNMIVGDDEIGAAGTGDITGVTAGTGLTGGGDTGAVTLSLATAISDAVTANTTKVSYTPATPGNIGGTTPAEGHFTALTAQSFDYGTPAPGTTGEMYVFEDPNNGGSSTGWKAPSQLLTDIIYTLPSTDGTDGQVMATNGLQVLSWVDAGAGTETDPVFTAWTKDYNDLINTPTIPVDTDDQTAAEVTVNTTNFAVNLSATDTTVQAALDTLDDMISGGVDLTAPGPIGSVTPNTGAFTTLIANSFDYGAPAIGETGEIGLSEDPTNGVSTVTLKADSDIAADTTILLPSGITLAPGSVPATATTACSVGMWSVSAAYVYYCIATDTWVRAAVATW